MPHTILRLNNGIKLIHKEVLSPVSHFGILLNAGTRDEGTNKEGVAHFVEHTLFKGTSHRKGYQILRRMEDVGGDLNASTSKEETWIHSSFLTSDYERAIELLADIFFYSTFPEKELEKEKDVILEEIKYYKDSPAELIFDDFEEQVYKEHPLGRSILGTAKSVKSMSREDILTFIKTQYTLNNLILSSVGNISTAKLMKWCNHYFGNEKITDISRVREPFSHYKPSMEAVPKKTNQAHLMLGCPAYSLYEDKRTPFLLLTNLLGGQGLNTRLNMTIREKLGLAYTVEANYSQFSDTGLFTVYTGCGNDYWERCIELVYKEFDKLRHEKLGTLQLHYAKKQFIGQMAISNEMKLNEMLSIGRSGLFFEQVETIEEVIDKINAISSAQIQEVAQEILIRDNFSARIFMNRK